MQVLNMPLKLNLLMPGRGLLSSKRKAAPPSNTTKLDSPGPVTGSALWGFVPSS